MEKTKTKIDFKKKKDNFMRSIQEVENFLENVTKWNKYKKIYKILKGK